MRYKYYKIKLILSILLAVLSWSTSNAQTAFIFNDLDSQVLVWKIYETVNGKYNGTYYVEWNAFIGGSKNIVGKYTNTKGKTFKINLKCTSISSAR